MLAARAREAPDPAEAPGRIFKHWNSHDALTRHRSLTDAMRAITRYAELCQQERAPGYNQWGLGQLMSREEGAWIDQMLDPAYQGIQNIRPPPGHTKRSQQNVRNVQDWIDRNKQHD